MPRIRATVWLPFRLKLQDGAYPTGQADLQLVVHDGRAQGAAVSLTRDQVDTDDPAEQSRLNGRHADLLLNLTNRLLRCYRAITRNPTITELSRERAGRFEFDVVSAGGLIPVWERELIFEASPPTVPVQSPRRIAKRVRESG